MICQPISGQDIPTFETYPAKMNSNIVIREIRPTEFEFLEEMLYQAIFLPDKSVVLPRNIIHQPDLKPYIEGFGRALYQKHGFADHADDGKTVIMVREV